MPAELKTNASVCHHISLLRFFFFSCFFSKEGRADAVPTTRNYTPDSPDLDERRGQPLRSAMARSRPGGTALLITVTSAPSKFNCRAENLLLYLDNALRRHSQLSIDAHWPANTSPATQVLHRRRVTKTKIERKQRKHTFYVPHTYPYSLKTENNTQQTYYCVRRPTTAAEPLPCPSQATSKQPHTASLRRSRVASAISQRRPPSLAGHML